MADSLSASGNASIGPSASNGSSLLQAVIAQTEAETRSLERFLSATDTQTCLQALVELLPPPSGIDPKTVRHWYLRQVAQLDELLIRQLNRIIQAPRFQKLESSWRGLNLLLNQAAGADNIKVRVLDISWREVTKDIDKAMEFDQSQLFQKIYSDEFGQPGGEPFGVLLGDYEVCHRPLPEHPYDDVSTLLGLSQIAAGAFAPFVCAAAPQLFGLDDYSGLGQPIDLENVFRQQEYVPWNGLRDHPDTRFLAVTVPRMLMREPYQLEIGAHGGIRFRERTGKQGGQGYLWGNPCFALGSVLIREFADVGWFSHIHGVPRDMLAGGLVMNLPITRSRTDEPGLQAGKPVCDVVVTDSLERRLGELGLMSLSQCYGVQFAAFHSNPSLHRPKRFDTTYASVNSRLSAMLQHVLCASRFAHYIKVMVRDKVGSFTSAADCERMVREWLHRYSSGRDDLDWESQARYPLREASVEVRENPAQPGSYLSNIYLRPHYQADHMVSELRLTTELAAGLAA